MSMSGFDEKGEVADAAHFGTVTVYRQWLLGANGELRAVSAGKQWTAGWNTATCTGARYVFASAFGQRKRPDPAKLHRSPADGCGCGFWGYWLPEGVTRTGGAASKNRVFGVAEVGGRMRRGPLGLRVEKARIVALHVPRFTDRLRLRIFCNYPAARVYRKRDDLLRDYPPVDATPFIGKTAREAYDETPRSDFMTIVQQLIQQLVAVRRSPNQASIQAGPSRDLLVRLNQYQGQPYRWGNTGRRGKP